MPRGNISSSVPALAQLRQALDLSQAQFARKLDVSPFTVSTWETGNRTPGVDRLKQIADFFCCSVDKLFQTLSRKEIALILADYHQREALRARELAKTIPA